LRLLSIVLGVAIMAAACKKPPSAPKPVKATVDPSAVEEEDDDELEDELIAPDASVSVESEIQCQAPKPTPQLE